MARGDIVATARTNGWMMKLYATDHPLTTDKDISSLSFWQQPFIERDTVFGWLREHAPVSWHGPLEDPALPPEVHGEAGFWAVVGADDIQHVSRNPDLFSSEAGGVEMRAKHPDLVQPPSFIEMDPPRHNRYRRIMSAAFTPRAVARLDPVPAAVLATLRQQGSAQPEAEALAFAAGECTRTPPLGAGAPPDDYSPLTRREWQVAEQVARGRSNRQIASDLVISTRTVDGHVENIFAKLGFNARASRILGVRTSTFANVSAETALRQGGVSRRS